MVLSCCPLSFVLCGAGKGNKKASVVIVLLDRTELEADLTRTTTGSDLMEAVFEYLGLSETAYFGFRFQDANSQTVSTDEEFAGAGAQNLARLRHNLSSKYSTQFLRLQHWLDPSRRVLAQVPSSSSEDRKLSALYLGVKFYAADPCRLRDEVTRYQFFLQLRSDVAQGRLPLARRETAAELAGYVLQCESRKTFSELKKTMEPSRAHTPRRPLLPAPSDGLFPTSTPPFSLRFPPRSAAAATQVHATVCSSEHSRAERFIGVPAEVSSRCPASAILMELLATPSPHARPFFPSLTFILPFPFH